MNNSAQLVCYGGTGSVTGANFVLDILDSGASRIMVDCGLEQGVVEDAEKRFSFPYDPKSITTLLVTHAHMDHIGRIPLLVSKGFKGPIYSTPATKEVAALMFDDALAVMAEEHAKKGTEPLYGKDDVETTLSAWQTHDYHEMFSPVEGVVVRFKDAGHVLGSAMIECTRAGRTIVFTGDLGNSPSPLMRETEALSSSHYLVMESVYGDRLHEDREERRERLREYIEAARARGGVLLIPAFSLERTQVLLYEMKQLLEEKRMKPIDMFLDSPLAIRLNEVYRKHVNDFNDDAKREATKGDLFTFPGLHISEHSTDSREIQNTPSPKVIIAGSGMSYGGRIRFHEKQFLGDNKTTILFVGYQAIGTLGRRIQEGQKKVRIDDTWIRVRAHVDTLHGYSAHADRDGLLRVVETAVDTLERVFVAMGEPHSAMFLAQRIRDFLGINAIAPKAEDAFTLDW